MSLKNLKRQFGGNNSPFNNPMQQPPNFNMGNPQYSHSYPSQNQPPFNNFNGYPSYDSPQQLNRIEFQISELNRQVNRLNRRVRRIENYLGFREELPIDED